MLDDDVQDSLRKLLAKSHTKNQARKSANRPARKHTQNSTFERDATAVTSAYHDIQEEAAAAGGSTTATTSYAAATVSGVPPLSEKASLSAALLEDPRTQPLWNVQREDVTLPVALARSFERWKAEPLTFLQGESVPIPSSLKEHYDYALAVYTSTVSNKILWRFISTAYYDVISAHSRSERYSITKEAVAFVVSVVCESSFYDGKVVEKDIISWAKDGARYRALADELEALSNESGVLANKSDVLGCYFFFPELSEWM